MTELVIQAIANKDVFTTLIILSVFVGVVIPMMNKNNKAIVDAINNMNEKFHKTFGEHEKLDHMHLEKIFEGIREHNEHSAKKFDMLQSKVGKQSLTPDQASRMLLAEMGYTSRKKIQAIKQILVVNHIQERKVMVKEKVYNVLAVFSQEYVNVFSQYYCKAGLMSEWLERNFTDEDFNKFVDEIFEIMLQQDEKMTKDEMINWKLTQIGILMDTLQIDLSLKIIKDCK